MPCFHLLLGILCVHRVAHLLVAEDGPWDLVVHLRRRAGGGVLGKLIDCFDCTSLWAAAPFAWILGEDAREQLLFVLAFSAGAMVLERITVVINVPALPIARYEEDPP